MTTRTASQAISAATAAAGTSLPACSFQRTGRAAAALLVASMLIGCASTAPPAARGREMSLRYGTVTRIDRAPLASAAPAGAIVGGFTGLVLSRNHSTGSQIASGIGGAALGALATKALEGERMGYVYDLRYRSGDESRFFTEKGYLRVGDCVSVERGEYANLRRVDASRCADSTPPADMDMQAAAQCHAAKDQLLAASTDSEIDAASRKVTLLCRFTP